MTHEDIKNQILNSRYQWKSRPVIIADGNSFIERSPSGILYIPHTNVQLLREVSAAYSIVTVITPLNITGPDSEKEAESTGKAVSVKEIFSSVFRRFTGFVSGKKHGEHINAADNNAEGSQQDRYIYPDPDIFRAVPGKKIKASFEDAEAVASVYRGILLYNKEISQTWLYSSSGTAVKADTDIINLFSRLEKAAGTHSISVFREPVRKVTVFDRKTVRAREFRPEIKT